MSRYGSALVTPLEQTLIGAAAGGFGAASASILATASFARRSQRKARHDERVERALENILQALEGDHCRLVNRYRRQFEVVTKQLGTETPTAYGHVVEAAYAIAWSDLLGMTEEFAELTRQLRLFVSRIDDEPFRARCRAYFDAVMKVYISARLAHEKKLGSPEPVETLVLPLRALLKETNSRLGHTLWDPAEDRITQG